VNSVWPLNRNQIDERTVWGLLCSRLNLIFICREFYDKIKLNTKVFILGKICIGGPVKGKVIKSVTKLKSVGDCQISGQQFDI
jgi:hypothetical protein